MDSTKTQTASPNTVSPNNTAPANAQAEAQNPNAPRHTASSAAGSQHAGSEMPPLTAQPDTDKANVADAQEAAAHDGIGALQKRIEELEAQNQELSEQHMRAQAELQNVQRRAQEEAGKTRKFAISTFAQGLLPVLDSLDAGLAADNATTEQMREGAAATLRQFKTALEQNKVLEVAPAPGAPFDPNLHQAIGTVPASEAPGLAPNSVAQILQKGYTLAERVLRPALVMVVAEASG